MAEPSTEPWRLGDPHPPVCLKDSGFSALTCFEMGQAYRPHGTESKYYLWASILRHQHHFCCLILFACSLGLSAWPTKKGTI